MNKSSSEIILKKSPGSGSTTRKEINIPAKENARFTAADIHKIGNGATLNKEISENFLSASFFLICSRVSLYGSNFTLISFFKILLNRHYSSETIYLF